MQMMDTLFESIKKQRLAWSWAVIIGLFLVVLGHAPVFPVIAGCALAIAISTGDAAAPTKEVYRVESQFTAGWIALRWASCLGGSMAMNIGS